MSEDTQLILTHIQDISDEIRQIVDDTHPRKGSTFEFDSAIIDGVTYTIIVIKYAEPAKMSKYAENERYRFSLRTNLSEDNKRHMNEVKSVFYDVLNELFPDSQVVVNNDHLSGEVRGKHQTDKKEFEDML